MRGFYRSCVKVQPVPDNVVTHDHLQQTSVEGLACRNFTNTSIKEDKFNVNSV